MISKVPKNSERIIAIVLVAQLIILQQASSASGTNSSQPEDDSHVWLRADHLFRQAVDMRNASTPDLATIKEAISIYPDDPAYYCEQAKELALYDRRTEALQSLYKAIALEPKFGRPWLEVACVLSTIGNNSAALWCLRKSLAIDDSDPEAWETLGVYREAIGKYADAEAAFKTSLKTLDESAPTKRHRPYFAVSDEYVKYSCLQNLGHLRFQQFRYVEAKQFYEQAGAADVTQNYSNTIHALIEKTDRKIAEGSPTGTTNREHDSNKRDSPHAQGIGQRRNGPGEIGVKLVVSGTNCLISDVLPGMPAALAGLKSGDKILAIDGESTVGISIEGAMTLEQGPIDTDVRLSVVHADDVRPAEDIKLRRVSIVPKTI